MNGTDRTRTPEGLLTMQRACKRLGLGPVISTDGTSWRLKMDHARADRLVALGELIDQIAGHPSIVGE